MSEPTDLVFHYYREPVPKPAGVTKGYMVIWDGKPGPAKIADMAQLVGDDGESVFTQPGEFRDCEVIDDRSEA